jgi:phage tail-like protein
VRWHRLQAIAKALPANAHLDLYAFVSNDLTKHPTVDPNSADPFSDPKWQSIDYTTNLDVTDLFIGPATASSQDETLGGRAKYLWIGALFTSDGSASPWVSQLRVEFDYPSYAQNLPAVYRNTAGCGEFLSRLLSLFDSFFSRVEWEIESLPALFDPAAAPRQFLRWLAGCMGLNLDDNWDDETQRRIIARIFELSGKRGTAEGLRECLRLLAGVDATVEEPLLHAAWWALPSSGDCCRSCAESSGSGDATWQGAENSLLGWTTMLAPAQPQGVVVGTSAVLDQSHLISDEDFGAPLFSDVAYQFSVEVYRSQVMCPETLANVRAIIEQEKPAHTAYHLCIIDPRFRVGFQSRLGIDTVVAGQQRSLSLGTEQCLGLDSVLAGSPPSLLGTETRLGATTRLG